MPDQETIKRARQDARQGKSPSTQAGEFVREEFHHIREGKHGARSARQAIAIGLSKARRSGVKLPPPRQGKVSEKARHQARLDLKKGGGIGTRKASARRSKAIVGALKREGQRAASHLAISRQTHRSARNRTAAERSATARKAVRTKRAAA
jgi:hypothetical protein